MKNILIITYWSFDDALIQTYTLPYVDLIRKQLPPGSRIFLVSLEKDDSVLTGKRKQSITDNLDQRGISWYPFQYYPLGIGAAFLWIQILLKLARLIRSQKIDVIHCWATLAGALGYLLSKITGKPLVIDSYEPHAEAMVENGTWPRGSIAFRILFDLEKRQTRRASHLIAATAGMKAYALKKYDYEIDQLFVKPACVDLELFDIQRRKNPALLAELGLTDKLVCVYAGKFGGIYQDKEVFDFLAAAQSHWGKKFGVLLLTGHTSSEIHSWCSASGLNPDIVVTRFVDHRGIPDYIGLGDFAITPVKPVATKRYCTPIKDGEYWAMGLPVVIPAGISDDSDIIREHSIGAVLDEFNTAAYQEALKTIDLILAIPNVERVQRIRNVAHQYRRFGIAELVYRGIYSGEPGD